MMVFSIVVMVVCVGIAVDTAIREGEELVGLLMSLVLAMSACVIGIALI